jgi:hypothetical protein
MSAMAIPVAVAVMMEKGLNMSDLTWHLRLPERLREDLEPVATANGRTTGNLVRHILEMASRDYVAPRKAKRKR